MSERQTASSPYVGLRVFEASDAARMFGREREAAALRDLLIERRIVLLSAGRGAGKTSLINAGLIPRLQADGFRVLPPIRTGTPLPPDAPATNPFVLAALLSLESSLAPERQVPPEELARSSFKEYLSRQAEPLQLADRTLLIIDQMEEALTPGAADSADLTEFFRQIGEALQDPTLFAIFSVHEESLPTLDPYLDLIPTQLATRFHLERLTRDEALDAVRVRPKRRADRSHRAWPNGSWTNWHSCRCSSRTAQCRPCSAST